MTSDLAPQRPRSADERPEPPAHILEPEWQGTRALARLGHDGPRFVGYSGPVEAPDELYDALLADARCTTAIVDGVLVPDWRDEPELEMDPDGAAYVRSKTGRLVFAAFDLLEVDGQSLLDVPLLERKRHLEGLLRPSHNVRLTTYVTRGLRSWHETLKELGFRRVVLKAWNSVYAPGEINGDWVSVAKLKPPRS